MLDPGLELYQCLFASTWMKWLGYHDSHQEISTLWLKAEISVSMVAVVCGKLSSSSHRTVVKPTSPPRHLVLVFRIAALNIVKSQCKKRYLVNYMVIYNDFC